MKKLAVIALAALAAFAWLVWLRPPPPEEAEPEVATEVAVRVGSITRAVLRTYVTAYGYVEPEPAGARPAASASVSPAVPGIVVAALRSEGQSVANGDLLFQLDSRVADIAVDFAAQNLDRQRRLLQIEGTSERAFQEAEQRLDAARVQQALLQIRAPLAGTVTRVFAKPGDAVDLGSVLATIVDLDRLVVSAQVPSAELSMLSVGQSADVRIDDAVSPVRATVTFISPQVDVQTGTALVRAALPAGTQLRAGQFVTLRIISAERAGSLAVPLESVVTNAAGESVIAIVSGDTATQKLVRTGIRDGGLVEIEANGLDAGMTVVTQGAYGLPERSRIRVLDD